MLSLTLGTRRSFGAFVPAVARTYDAAAAATVVSTAGDATLSVTDAEHRRPGHLVNGTFALAVSRCRSARPTPRNPNPAYVPLSETAGTPSTLLTYTGPTAGADAVTLGFRQAIGATDVLRAGNYSKTLTFTLSTTHAVVLRRGSRPRGAGRGPAPLVLSQENRCASCCMIVLLALLAGAAATSRRRRPTPTPDADGRGEADARPRGLLAGRQGLLRRATAPGADERRAEDVEAEYHQPPKPAEAGLGETITLTGTNIGVRMRVTVTDVERVGDLQGRRAGAREHRHHRTTRRAAAAPPLTYADGEPQPRRAGRERAAAPTTSTCRSCGSTVGARPAAACCSRASGDEKPERFQLALEIVPADAGGIWNLG